MFELAVRDAVTPRTHNDAHPIITPDPLKSSGAAEHLFVHARDALAITDLASGRISHWNPAAEQLFGYSASEAVGRPAEMLMPPAVARLHRERIAHYRRTGDDEILTGRGLLGIPAVTRRGDQIRVELAVQPLEPAASILLTFRDARCQQLAELNALDAARAESARAETETRLRRCEELLRESTRDFERPLIRARRAALRLARLASQGEVSPRRLALLARVVEARTDELERSIQQALDIAALEAGTLEIALDRVNLVPLLGRLIAAARARSSLHRLILSAPQGLTAQCDPRHVESVVHDLIARAVRRNPRGCWIDVDLRRPLAGIARIEVRDYGRRLADRERQQLTNPATPDRGWLVNRRLVELHGGSLSVDFPRDGGVRAVLVLPTHHTRRSGQSSAAGGPA